MMQLICRDTELLPDARDISRRYGFELVRNGAETGPYFLQYGFDGLALCPADNPKASVRVDFAAGANDHRRRFGGGKGQDIARAVGIRSYCPSVLDATAGLGRDSFVLASLGCQVLACERHPVVAALLEDGLRRGACVAEVAEIIGRIRFHYGNARELLLSGREYPDVIYLDPMFDHDPRQKAAVKKDMQAFRDVVGQDEDSDALFLTALDHVRCRVAVKRARNAEPLAGLSPVLSLKGKANRFDVYVLAKVAPPEA